MPNHCYNQLWIYGPDDDVARFKRLAGLDQTPPRLDFGAFATYPAHWRQMDEEMEPIRKLQGQAYADAMAAYKAKWGTHSDGFNSGGYEWRCANWGTKWGAYDVGVTEWCGHTVVLFQTAWSPPLPVIDAMASAFPLLELELQWSELGCRIHGFRSHRHSEGVSQVQTEEWSTYDGILGG